MAGYRDAFSANRNSLVSCLVSWLLSFFLLGCQQPVFENLFISSTSSKIEVDFLPRTSPVLAIGDHFYYNAGYFDPGLGQFLLGRIDPSSKKVQLIRRFDSAYLQDSEVIPIGNGFVALKTIIAQRGGITVFDFEIREISATGELGNVIASITDSSTVNPVSHEELPCTSCTPEERLFLGYPSDMTGWTPTLKFVNLQTGVVTVRPVPTIESCVSVSSCTSSALPTWGSTESGTSMHSLSLQGNLIAVGSVLGSSGINHRFVRINGVVRQGYAFYDLKTESFLDLKVEMANRSGGMTTGFNTSDGVCLRFGLGGSRSEALLILYSRSGCSGGTIGTSGSGVLHLRLADSSNTPLTPYVNVESGPLRLMSGGGTSLSYNFRTRRLAKVQDEGGFFLGQSDLRSCFRGTGVYFAPTARVSIPVAQIADGVCLFPSDGDSETKDFQFVTGRLPELNSTTYTFVDPMSNPILTPVWDAYAAPVGLQSFPFRLRGRILQNTSRSERSLFSPARVTQYIVGRTTLSGQSKEKLYLVPVSEAAIPSEADLIEIDVGDFPIDPSSLTVNYDQNLVMLRLQVGYNSLTKVNRTTGASEQVPLDFRSASNKQVQPTIGPIRLGSSRVLFASSVLYSGDPIASLNAISVPEIAVFNLETNSVEPFPYRFENSGTYAAEDGDGNFLPYSARPQTVFVSLGKIFVTGHFDRVVEISNPTVPATRWGIAVFNSTTLALESFNPIGPGVSPTPATIMNQRMQVPSLSLMMANSFGSMNLAIGQLYDDSSRNSLSPISPLCTSRCLYRLNPSTGEVVSLGTTSTELTAANRALEVNSEIWALQLDTALKFYSVNSSFELSEYGNLVSKFGSVGIPGFDPNNSGSTISAVSVHGRYIFVGFGRDIQDSLSRSLFVYEIKNNQISFKADLSSRLAIVSTNGSQAQVYVRGISVFDDQLFIQMTIEYPLPYFSDTKDNATFSFYLKDLGL